MSQAPPLTLRPEARGMCWKQLVTPAKSAVRQLLQKLSAAVDANASQAPSESGDNQSADLASSILLTGKRGCGKTTVLLTARHAVEHSETFFDGLGEEENNEVQDLREDVEKLAESIVWLDVLDLEPLPPEANLLATLLVRVRGAFDREQDHAGPDTSLFEQDEDDCWDKIDRLVGDATFMWEDVTDTDARHRASLQIKAAEIYASFRSNFSSTIAAVCRMLSRSRFGHKAGNKVVLVLPIDNVDRSSDHLHAIMKLSQMVSCRQLWLVVAGSRSDFQVLLERAFQKELTADTRDSRRQNRFDEDEALAIVRRQAAAAQRRVLPPAHSITIEPMTAEDVLDFSLTLGTASCRESAKKLCQLLEEMPLYNDQAPKSGTFLDLFDVTRRIAGKSRGEEDTRMISEVGRYALRMPARNAVDLWQAAYLEPKIARGPGRVKEEWAVDVTSKMLRRTINESDLPSSVTDILNEQILKDDPGKPGRVILDFSEVDNPINLGYSYSVAAHIDGPSKKMQEPPHGKVICNSWVNLLRLHSIVFQINNMNAQIVRLPLDVGGWLMLLLDLLYPAPGRILNHNLEFNMWAVETLHSVRFGGMSYLSTIRWPTPNFCRSYQFGVFFHQWQGFTEKLNKLMRNKCSADPESKIRFLRAALIDNVCSVGEAITWCWDENCAKIWPKTGIDDEELHKYEGATLKRAVELYSSCRKYRRNWPVQQWLLEDLPLLFVPQLSLLAEPRLENKDLELPADSDLPHCWTEDFAKKRWKKQFVKVLDPSKPTDEEKQLKILRSIKKYWKRRDDQEGPGRE